MTALPTLWFDRDLTDEEVASLAGRAAIAGPDLDELARSDGAVIGIARQWNAAAFADAGDRLTVVSRSGIGYDNVDVAAAAAAGVVVCNAPAAPTVSTAEHTIALLLAITKDLPFQQARSNRGAAGADMTRLGLELDGATVGLIGCGRIARRVAGAAQALGMTVLASDPLLDVSPVTGVDLVDLDAIWADADVVSLHAPAIPATHHMINAETLAAMKTGVYLINCARGPLIDHDALLAALDSGQVRGAGLDVTDPEPLPVGHRLLDRSDVIVTPHIASSTAAGRNRLFDHAVDNALGVLAGTEATIVAPPQSGDKP